MQTAELAGRESSPHNSWSSCTAGVLIEEAKRVLANVEEAFSAARPP